MSRGSATKPRTGKQRSAPLKAATKAAVRSASKQKQGSSAKPGKARVVAGKTKPAPKPAPAASKRKMASVAAAKPRSAPLATRAATKPKLAAVPAPKPKLAAVPAPKPKLAAAAATKPKLAAVPASKPKVAPASAASKPAGLAVASSSALFQKLDATEQRAVKLALGGQPTLLECSPRARDAALFTAAASLASQPVLVASPLASELFEQAVQATGLDVVTFGSFVDAANLASARKRVARGGSLLIVVEPAQLVDSALRQAFEATPLALVGIAAAHACSEHAHELSPGYLGLREALSAFRAPVLASCTSTSARVVGQIAEAIGANSSSVLRGEEPKLGRAAQVVRSSERKAALFAAILSYGAPGVVLTATSQEADVVYAELSARQVGCVRAHAGMAPAERSAALARFAEPAERLVLVTQSPHANASGLAGCPEAHQTLTSAPPRPDLRFVLHYQAPLSPEQQFEDLAWLPPGAHSLVLADSSDAALVQALLAQQRIKPAAIESVAQALSQVAEDRPAYADTVALRAGTSRRSAERVLSAFSDRNLITRDSGQISRRVAPEQLAAEARLLSARFAALRAADLGRAELVARYVTSRHGSAPSAAQPSPLEVTHVRA